MIDKLYPLNQQLEKLSLIFPPQQASQNLLWLVEVFHFTDDQQLREKLTSK